MSTAFVEGFSHDVFISYAHVDDIPPSGIEKGWVSTLVQDLRTLLSRRLGRADNHSVWMDYRLAGNDRITPTLLTEIERSATLVVFLSQGYLASEWCRREKDTFLSKIKDLSEKGSPVFVVEMDKLADEAWFGELAELADLKGYRFWHPDPDSGRVRLLAYPCPTPEERAYYNLLNDLSADLATKLRDLASRKPALGVAENPPSSTTVFLAEVTDDLAKRHDEVKRFLQQQGLCVLPEFYYPNDPQQFREAQERDLAKSDLFVQLLSSISGKCPPGADKGFPHLQYHTAKAANVPILQWCAPGLDLDGVDDDGQLELLRLETVAVMPIEEFKAEALRRATIKPKVTVEPPSDALVFVNHGAEDMELAEQIRKVLDKLNLGYSLPLLSGPPAELRKDLKRSLLDSDVVVWLYGQVPQTWVREQLHNYLKVRRNNPARKVAVCEGPPQTKDELRMKLPGMEIIDCRSGVSEAMLQEFLGAIRSESRA